MVKCESLRINMYRITHTGKISKFSRNKFTGFFFFTLFKCVDVNILNAWASLVTKRSIEICGKGHLATSPEERNGFNEDQQFWQEKQRVRSYFFAQSNSSPFHFFCPGFLFKILGTVTNSLILRNAISDVNEICRSRSRAKSEKKVSYFQHLRIITPFIIWYQHEPITPIVKHSFSPTSLTF